MSVKFMDENFLLTNDTAVKLFHDYAKDMPILDYHCHIIPQEIAENRMFDNISQVWLGGDHYKWRIMRANGVAEEKITGANADDREKFNLWSNTLEKALGNPLFHWSHLELQRYFDYDGVLNSNSADEVWEQCNKKLATPDMRVREIIKNSNVAGLCTTDDPVDDLKWHKAIAEDKSFKTVVLPSWRPDRCVNINLQGFSQYIDTLSQVSGVKIDSISALCAALEKRLDYFHEVGCRISDHGLDDAYYSPIDEKTANDIFTKVRAGGAVSKDETDSYKTYILLFLAKEYCKRGWAMQLHFAAARNTNTQMFKKLGPDTGYDCIGKSVDTTALISFFDALEQQGALPKTIVYSLNPNDEAVLASILGCFQGEGMKNKMQLGVPWWFNDTKSNMEQGLVTLANASLLGNFVGMLTDSRSFLSYPRHEYFRRILCNTLGEWAEKGEIPADIKMLGKIVQDISFNNAKEYFQFPGV